MKKLTFAVAGSGFILFLFAFIFMLPTSSPGASTIDFKSYYGTAGQTVQGKIASDPAYQELLSLTVFEDVDLSISHAGSKHADDRPVYDECMNSGNTILAFEDPSTKHCIEVMSTVVEESGHMVERFLLRVVKKVNGRFYELTAFSEEWESLYEVEKYLCNGGYMQIWP